MSKKLKVVICVVMTFVFLLIPFSAFAVTDDVTPTKLIKIAKDANPDMYTIDDNHTTVIFEDDNNYYLVIVSKANSMVCGSYGSSLEIVRNGPYSFDYQKYIYSKLNIYDVAYDTHQCNGGVYLAFEVGKPTNILYSNKNIYQSRVNDIINFEQIFFQKMNSIPTYPQNRVPLNTVISSIQLTDTLSELIAMLPLLLPVLITFLAIRKGIAFCLRILKTA